MVFKKTRFVEVDSTRFIAHMTKIILASNTKAGVKACWSVIGNERVVTINVGKAMVRIFTTMRQDTDEVRSCGKDAVRIVVGVVDGRRFVPTCKSRRVLRTAPAKIEDRQGYFLERVTEHVRDAYKAALRVRHCSQCDGFLAERKGANGMFLGCVNYPGCRHTESLT
jgi:hypothetical protein